MREKFIVRQRDGEVVLGIRYTAPCGENGWKGSVMVGGPSRFEKIGRGLLKIVRKKCVEYGDSGHIVKRVGGARNKTRWRITGVWPGTWSAALKEIRRSFQVEQVRGFRRLMG